MVGILIAELLFGNWLKTNAIEKLRIIKDVNLEFDVSGIYNRTPPFIKYSRDYYGLRGRHHKPSEIDLLVVGGSTTDQRYIDDDETWDAVLEKCLHAKGKDINIGNAGVDGRSTKGHISNFKWWFPYIPSFKPKTFLFYIGINDYFIDLEERSYDKPFKTDYKENSFSLRLLLSRNSILYDVIRIVYYQFKTKFVFQVSHRSINFNNLAYTTKGINSGYHTILEQNLNHYQQRLNTLITLCKQLGANPVFVTNPTRNYRINNGNIEGVAKIQMYGDFPINGVDYYYIRAKMDSVTMYAAKKNNCIGITPPKDLWQDEDFYDYFHMTPKGTLKLGSYLAEQLWKDL
ncbi:MAG: SGNH/GDSL hydrolase family protein [Fibrobacteria bacterium]|nr:SGNH/GDSL hydrolase family protein [Fibrobacteria bacterium]